MKMQYLKTTESTRQTTLFARNVCLKQTELVFRSEKETDALRE